VSQQEAGSSCHQQLKVHFLWSGDFLGIFSGDFASKASEKGKISGP